MSLQAPIHTKEAALNLLLRMGKCNATKLASELGISVQAMRRHLRTLEQKGLVKSSPLSPGPGRPFNVWELTQKGKLSFNIKSQDFALTLLDSISSTLEEKSFKEILQTQAKKKELLYKSKIGTSSFLKTRLEELIKLRREEGFFSELKKATNGKGWQIIEYSCSIKKIAEAYPTFCEEELDLIRQIFPECKVERKQWCIEDGHCCGFLISPSN